MRGIEVTIRLLEQVFVCLLDTGLKGLTDDTKCVANASCQAAHAGDATEGNHGEDEGILDQVLTFFALHQALDRNAYLEHQVVHLQDPHVLIRLFG